MDKLEPVFRHRFWILLGICAPLIVYGYYSANGAIKQATSDRETELDGVISNVPSGDLPNESHKAGLGEINDELDLEVALAHQQIWIEQSENFVWPENFEEYVPDEFRGEFDQDARYIYKDEYEGLLRDTYEIAEPITQEGNRVTGKVAIQYEILPRQVFGDLSVSSESVWDAMEDIWYLRILLQAVREMNGSAPNIAKSPVRMITQLDLMGGDGQTGAAASASPSMAGGGEDMSEMMASMDGMFDGQDGGGRDEFGAGAFGGGASTVAFKPEDEFGKSVEARTVTTGAADAGLMPGGGGRSTRTELRYVALDESEPFRERGFYMSVLIDQQQIARFLITLSNSDWPIRIVRFHVGPNPQGTGGAGGGAGLRNQFAMGGGMRGGVDDYDMGALGFDESAFDPDYGGAGGAGAGGYGPQQYVNDSALAGAFTHPDLVQLEVLGAITFFNPLPEDVLAKVTAALEGTSPVSVEPESATEIAPLPDEGAETPADETPSAPDESLNQPSSPSGEDESEAEPDDEPSAPGAAETP